MTSWWLGSLPPVPDAVRALFYGGLLVFCLLDRPSPLDAPRFMAKTSREFYTPVGALRAVGIRWVSPQVLGVIRWVTIGCWIAATAGFIQPISSVLTFVGFAFLHAVNAGALGSNHSTHSALFALFCMCFGASSGTMSLDRYLFEQFGWPLLVEQGSVLRSGFAPHLLLVFLTYIMFAGGVSKIRHGGTGWLSGRPLQFYIEQSVTLARAPRIAQILVRSPRVCRYLALLAVAIELAAPAALFFPCWRTEFVFTWVGLHVGILLVMMPAYWIQMWCYLLVIDWTPLRAVVGMSKADSVNLAGVPVAELATLGTVISVVLIAVLILHIEQWPFTSVPMYSNGTIPAEYLLPQPVELGGLARRASRGDLSAWHQPWVPAESLEDITIVPEDDDRPVSLFDVVSAHDVPFVRWSQYAKVVRSVAIADLAAKPVEQPDDPTPEFPAAQFLAGLLPLIRNSLPDWHRYTRLQLVCLTTNGWFAVASVGVRVHSPA